MSKEMMTLMSAVLTGFFFFVLANGVSDEVEEHLKRLASSDWKEREDAQKALLALLKKERQRVGDRLWEELKKTKDAEVRDRLKAILDGVKFVPSDVRRRLLPLFERLKDENFEAVQIAAAKIYKLYKSGGEVAKFVPRFAERFFKNAPQPDFKLSLHLKNRVLQMISPPIEGTLTIENTSKKGGWIPLSWGLRFEAWCKEIIPGEPMGWEWSPSDLVVEENKRKRLIRLGRDKGFPFLWLPPGKKITLRLTSYCLCHEGTSFNISHDNELFPTFKFYFAPSYDIDDDNFFARYVHMKKLQKFHVDNFRNDIRQRVSLLPPKTGILPNNSSVRFKVSREVLVKGQIQVDLKIFFGNADEWKGFKKAHRMFAAVVGQKPPTIFREIKKSQIKIEDKKQTISFRGALQAPKKAGKYHIYFLLVKTAKGGADFYTCMTYPVLVEVKRHKK